ncbi:flagellar basal body rod protein FlgB [Botrimarina mediterranea]|uniref:Flagellar basal body rod protein FlgB n=1 Tax=Botrimarina mediterranea TaxID=2528022 RepID=A0A518KBS1_9BACT|nr:flagellar basal body protein [Botrimarina mediterranea]QDV75243.1 flagellar basal body rod protein FlgB [Botrimarina mediterranea]QDV79912.1 flagellar basal body rod protein FlgB [Planctomycetes bacterium K2D]
MLNPFANSTLPVLEQTVQFTQARHGVLAGNIANLNTPGYKARDLSVQAFQSSLRSAIDSSKKTYSPGDAIVLGDLSDGPHEGLMALGGERGPFDADSLNGLQKSMETFVYHDQRDVSLESQVTEISKNQSLHNLAITLMSQQFRQMRSAISETVA